jgi:hypothetical protein
MAALIYDVGKGNAEDLGNVLLNSTPFVDCGLPGCDVVESCEGLPTFRKEISASVSFRHWFRNGHRSDYLNALYKTAILRKSVVTTSRSVSDENGIHYIYSMWIFWTNKWRTGDKMFSSSKLVSTNSPCHIKTTILRIVTNDLGLGKTVSHDLSNEKVNC